MIITPTSVGFILLAVGLGVCGWYFLAAFKKESQFKKDRRSISYLLSSFLLVSALQNGVFGIGVLFSDLNPDIFFVTVLFNNVLLTINTMLGVATVCFIFFPFFARRFFISLVGLLGFSLIIYTVLVRDIIVATFRNHNLYTTVDSPLSSLLFLLLFINIGSFIFIFSQLSSRAHRRDTRMFSGLLSVFGIAGLINVFMRFVILPRVNPNAFGLEISTGFIGIGILVLIAIFSFLRKDKLLG